MLRLANYEKFAFEILPKVSWDYFNAAAEDRVTYNANFSAIKRFAFAYLGLLAIYDLAYILHVLRFSNVNSI